MTHKFKLHPTITRIVRVGEDIVFEGLPDFVNLSDPEGELLSLFTSLDTFDLSNFLSLASSEREEADLEAIFNALIERGLFIDASENTSVDDEYNNWIDFLARMTRGHYHKFAVPTGREAADGFSVYIAGQGELAEMLTVLLRDSGIDAATGASVTTECYSLCVVCGDGTASKEALRCMNREVVRRELNALYIDISVPSICIGPFYVPRSSACYDCLDARHKSNATVLLGSDSLDSQVRPLASAGPIPIAIGAGLAADIVVQMAHGLRHMVPAGTLIEFDLSSHTACHTRVARAPRCTTCGQNMGNYTSTSHFRAEISATKLSDPELAS